MAGAFEHRGQQKQREHESVRDLPRHATSVWLQSTTRAIILVFFPPLQLLMHSSGHDGIFSLSSLLCMLLDPLFLYAPVINEDTKCLGFNNRLKIAALVFRSSGDVRYLIRIYLRIKDAQAAESSSSLRKMLLRLANDALCILPIPQVAILIFLPNMWGANSLKTMSFLNSLICLQYIPRAYPIYVLFKEINTDNIGERRGRDPNWSSFSVNNPNWMIFNIIAYIIASHIFGAFWYYFSILREVDCWGHACRIENGCEFTTSCVQNTHKSSITILNKLCPTNPPDKQVFDFGIFQDALESGLQGSTSFSRKYFQCLSMGIRSLSSFGSNLNTSADGAENLLVVVFSICGLVLFMYLMGHMQTYIQKVFKSDTIRERMRMIKIGSILHEYGLADEDRQMEKKIKLAVKDKLVEDENHIVENMFSILSLEHAKRFADEIKCALFLDKLKKVDGLQDMDDLVLAKICKHLKPVIYRQSRYIIREGEPLDMMFFLTQGIVLIYDSGGSSTTVQAEKEKNGLYGQELLAWAKGASTHLSILPFSVATVKSHNKVEIFAIKATDLQRALFLGRDDDADSTDLTEIICC